MTSVLPLPRTFHLSQDLFLALFQVDWVVLTVLLTISILFLMTNDIISWEEGTNWRNLVLVRLLLQVGTFPLLNLIEVWSWENCHIYCSILLLRDTYENISHIWKGFCFPNTKYLVSFTTQVLWFSNNNSVSNNSIRFWH